MITNQLKNPEKSTNLAWKYRVIVTEISIGKYTCTMNVIVTELLDYMGGKNKNKPPIVKIVKLDKKSINLQKTKGFNFKWPWRLGSTIGLIKKLNALDLENNEIVHTSQGCSRPPWITLLLNFSTRVEYSLTWPRIYFLRIKLMDSLLSILNFLIYVWDCW